MILRSASVRLCLAIGLLFVSTFSSAQKQFPPKRELRGVWIATVANIDWPSSIHLSSAEQQEEFKYILDQHQRNGINAVFGQVRPAADAFYAKSREPWSSWLNGQQGRAPDPFYDPMQMMIEECHKKNMEFHAWINPYRATHTSGKGPLAPDHITKQKPEWFFKYGGQLLFNPGIPQVREYIVSVIMDMVRNYDVDAIHFDDYFYPYPVGGQVIPDRETFKKYPNGEDNLEDWRRENVNLLIKMAHDSIHAAKPWVKFGVSPFGIWKNDRHDPDGSDTNGSESFYNQFADSRKWQKEGWVDYMIPQIYFNTGHPKADFETLTDWWAQNSFGRDVYIGMGAYRAGMEAGWRNPKHFPEQVAYTRNHKEVQGQVYFSSKPLLRNPLGILDSLKNNYYHYPALLPTMPWIDSIPPLAPKNLLAQQLSPGVVKLSWLAPDKASDGETATSYVVYRTPPGKHFELNDPRNIIAIIYKDPFFTDQNAPNDCVYQVSALDRLQNESVELAWINFTRQ